MESDGKIRSKHIGTSEVNSRALDNIRSSNFNGSKTNPEIDSGTEGWQILKSGFVVFNDAIFRGTIAAARIVSAVLESGVLNIRSGGRITVGGDDVAGVAPLVTLDETGLTIEGVLQPGLHLDADYDVQTSLQADSTLRTGASITFTVPSWVGTAIVQATHAASNISDTTGGDSFLAASVRIDGTTGGGTSIRMGGHAGDLTINAITTTFARLISSPGATITVDGRYQDTQGSSTDNAGSRLSATLIGIRG